MEICKVEKLSPKQIMEGGLPLEWFPGREKKKRTGEIRSDLSGEEEN